MTPLETVRNHIYAIADLGGRQAEKAELLAYEALAILDPYLERQRESVPRLLSDVSESSITLCEPLAGGAMQMRARLGLVEVRDLYVGNEATMSDETIVRNARASVLDSLRVALVRDRIDEASDRDLLDALDAAERWGDDEVGDILVAANNRGLRIVL